MYARRDLLRLGALGGAAAAGVAALPSRGLAQGASYAQSYYGSQRFAAPTTFDADAAVRQVAVHNLHTGESVETIYFDNGEYVPDALAAMNHVLRDFRTGDIHQMDPRVFDLLHTISRTVDSRAPFQIISGYRSPQTNEMLHETSSGVASNSYHMRGMAIDIRLPDVQLAHLHKAALLLQRGGVGYYPASDFIHVDVGPVRHWG
ncbi:MAG: DUF882 domain-containing protein [Caulobacteraceae bacterium]